MENILCSDKEGNKTIKIGKLEKKPLQVSCGG